MNIEIHIPFVSLLFHIMSLHSTKNIIDNNYYWYYYDLTLNVVTLNFHQNKKFHHRHNFPLSGIHIMISLKIKQCKHDIISGKIIDMAWFREANN